MCAHRHGMRVVLVVQLGWSRLFRASLAQQLGVLVAHLVAKKSLQFIRSTADGACHHRSSITAGVSSSGPFRGICISASSR